ncbi:FN3 domain-containing metallophosphoesterase family protein [Brevibacterium aurantiacum]|uniref:FN3 domain-containing metallophosphoesterase family protein n=1 Tax=Brevibacterium aurantiacum TaxID=273384 RepID=UPI0018676B13|nr:FN3 domain-containing metallophosphoesterase family protein [Brevibacterium aurantiacum]
MSILSVSALLAALVAVPVPAHAGLTPAEPTQSPSTSHSTQPEADEESAISDVVLQVGADESARNLSWMSENSGEGEVRWAKTSELEGSALPEDAHSAETSDSGLSTDLKRHYNHASMTGLEPDTEYSYQVGSEEDGYSAVAQFDTGGSGGDSEFLVFGDPQVGAGGGQPDDATGWDRTLNSGLETAQDPRFFFSLGDQVNSAGDQGQYEQYLAPEATQEVPQATTIGNHDVASKSYEQHFNRPNVSSDHGEGGLVASGGDYWFIDSGVLFININSNDSDTDEHAEFIDEVVAEHGDEARWTVLGFHHSIYSTATHNSDLDVKRLREAIPPVAARNDIDLVVSGHDHIYNRTFLMDAEGKKVESSDAGLEQEKEEGQTMYLTLTSSSGSKFYDYVPGLDWEAKSVHNDIPAFTRVRVSDEALRATTYEVPAEGTQQAEAQAASEQIDDVEITRSGDDAPEPGTDAGADADAEDAAASSDGSSADADSASADADGASAEADSVSAEADGASPEADGTDSSDGSNSADAGTSSDGAESDSDSDSERADSDAATAGTTDNDGTTEAEGTTDNDGTTESDGADANAASAAPADSGTTSANSDSAADGGDLPRTGTQLGLPIGLGAGAVIIGAVLLLVSKRRRSLR